MTDSHFVGTSGKHMPSYINKDALTTHTKYTSEVGKLFAQKFKNKNIEAVVAPAVAGIPLSQWTAYHLTRLRPDRPEVLALYSEHDDQNLVGPKKENGDISVTIGNTVISLTEGEQIILRRPRFVLKRGFDVDISGKRVLEIEDVLTTGGSAAKIADAIKSAGGILVGLAVLVNGGNVTPEACHVDYIKALINVEREIFTEEECIDHELCAKGVPINTDFGHGKAFLDRKQQA